LRTKPPKHICYWEYPLKYTVFTSRLRITKASQENNDVDEVIAILGQTNLDYVTAIFALSRLGYSLLLLSNRLAIEAYVSLLEKTKCQWIVNASAFEKSVQAIRAEKALVSYPLLRKSSYDLPHPSGPYFTREYDGTSTSKRTAFIIHSSGSTGLPKPIFQTHEAALMNYSSSLGYRAFLTLPLYHNHGLSTFFRAMYSGCEIGMFNAGLPLTTGNLITAMEKLKPRGFHGVPYALKLLSESRRGIELLKACEVVMFGGSSCPDDLGDRLVEAGVYLVSHYGA
jgi:acyl-CoA synthetase (AMP-forming)/AMP-acid ligase II